MSDILREPIEEFGLIKKSKTNTLFSKIGVVGCGKIGQMIARISSTAGIEVVFIEVSDEKIQEAIDSITHTLDEMIGHWGMTESEKRAILSRIQGAVDYNALKGCEFVIEAINAVDRGRRIADRKEIFRMIEDEVDDDCIIATNSTTIIVTELSSELKHKERSVGLHFLINSSEARMVELMRGLYTSDETYQRVIKFVNLINYGVIPVEESAGLVSVRMFTVILNEACEILMEGVAALKDIDETMKVGFGMRIGPFETADTIGLDKVVRWMDNMYTEFGDMKYKPSPVIKRLVRAKQFGVQTGKGFYK
ncbi:MAG: 3-hydroxyacyl-CoA dehydrogenase NAD-binding domain-containing protein, partial [Bacteroidota bacterium]|nr:3-hydroxyacyl-CoA dehydrogenase NAD-binding domain-containing protein [Bacteroidota bacterium]